MSPARIQKRKRSRRVSGRKNRRGLEGKGVCGERGEWEEGAVDVLEKLRADGEMAAGLERNGLCLRHGLLGLERWREAANREWLAGILQEAASRLREELREFLRKYDYRFGDEPFGEEEDAVSRAVDFLAGTEPEKQR